MADITLQSVTKRFKENIALDDVNLEIKNKEFYIIFGPSGAGKTTLLNIIAGIYVPEQGTISMNQKIINTVEPEDRNVAMVFENYALYPNLTVFDNMASPMRSPRYRQPEDKIKEEVNRVAKLLKIDWLLERNPSELSNGQRQRVSLGRALVRTPEVFLMDEPLTHLDAKLRHQMRAEFKEMQTNLNTTTVYVTHDYLEALSLGDRIAVINNGRIEQIGTPDDIYYRPATEFVAAAFGEPEINILDSDIVVKERESYLKLLGDGEHFMVPKDVIQMLEKCGYSSVRVGFRPKDILYKLTDDGSGMLQAYVYSFEPLGSKAILTAHLNDQLIRLVTPADLDVKIEQPIYLKFNTGEAIFFDVQTKKYLTRSGVKGGS
jgi:multiple sugar transport system ATP-binding protein